MRLEVIRTFLFPICFHVAQASGRIHVAIVLPFYPDFNFHWIIHPPFSSPPKLKASQSILLHLVFDCPFLSLIDFYCFEKLFQNAVHIVGLFRFSACNKRKFYMARVYPSLYLDYAFPDFEAVNISLSSLWRNNAFLAAVTSSSF